MRLGPQLEERSVQLRGPTLPVQDDRYPPIHDVRTAQQRQKYRTEGVP